MTYTEHTPTIAERLASAGTSSDLSVRVDVRGDVDYLIAAGMSPAPIGRYVFQLMTEWDACPKPPSATAEDLERIALHLPRIKTIKKGKRGVRTIETLDIAGARVKHERWMADERARILARLKSLHRLMDPHAGLLLWVTRKGYANPSEKLLDVLGWWADRRCTACGGTGEKDGRVCRKCKGLCQREVPHGLEGLAISEYIAAHVDKARRGAISGLKGIKQLKAFASGEKS